MRAGYPILLLAAVALAGCDRITGEADQKIRDAQAIGYACRVSVKAPEDCMKENDTLSPTSILSGWKAADKDIQENIIDPSMGKNAAAQAAPTATPAATGEAGKTATGKAEEKTAEKPATEKAGEKPAPAKNEKPTAAAKPGAANLPKAAH